MKTNRNTVQQTHTAAAPDVGHVGLKDPAATACSWLPLHMTNNTLKTLRVALHHALLQKGRVQAVGLQHSLHGTTGQSIPKQQKQKTGLPSQYVKGSRQPHGCGCWPVRERGIAAADLRSICRQHVTGSKSRRMGRAKSDACKQAACPRPGLGSMHTHQTHHNTQSSEQASIASSQQKLLLVHTQTLTPPPAHATSLSAQQTAA